MSVKPQTTQQYIDQLPDDRKVAIGGLRKAILDNLPEGFTEIMSYGMIGYVVPHSVYPPGYHCDPKQPLPFMGMASQKGHVTVYHMGVYADKKLMDWFVKEYSRHSKSKLDMGKGCIRFKKANEIPFDLIGALAGKMSAREWIDMYEKNIKK